jgi:hypothetical protein
MSQDEVNSRRETSRGIIRRFTSTNFHLDAQALRLEKGACLSRVTVMASEEYATASIR